MNFAKNLLKKYGWKEGDGLGKNNDGINKPLKATLKFDTAGLGVDKAASDFNNHWWERVFNEAAQNVKIENDKNGTVNIDLKNPEDTVEITTQSYSVKKLKKAKALNGEDTRYNNFIQSATLSKSGNQIENVHKIELSDIAVASTPILTDEQLFEACGGRTAHKGARHGLTLNGKLSRIERQEEELLEKMKANYNGLKKQNNANKYKTTKKIHKHESNSYLNEISINKKKKKKKNHKDSENVEETILSEELKVEEPNSKELAANETVINKKRPSDVESSEQEPKIKRKKKKRAHSKEVDDEVIKNDVLVEHNEKESLVEEMQMKSKSKKKKRSSKSVDEANKTDVLVENSGNESLLENVQFKMKLKKKKLNKV